MKKIITLLFSFYAISTFAQITYNESDGPKVGVTLYSRILENNELMNFDPLKETGGNKSWDVRGVYVDNGILEYIGTQNLYFKSHFPGTNLCRVDKPNPDSSFIMMEKNSTGLYILGTRDSSLDIVFTPKLTLVPFPLSYGMNFQNDASADYTQQGINFKQDFKSNANVDSWGTIRTNDGTFPVIKMKTIRIIEISVMGFPYGSYTIENYSWLTSGLADPIVTLEFREIETPLGLTNDTSLTNTYKQEIVSTRNIQNAGLKLSVSPNPVSDLVSIQCQNVNFKEATYSIINEEGKTVMNGIAKNNEILHLNLNTLTSGNYLVQMLLDKKTMLFDILTKQ